MKYGITIILLSYFSLLGENGISQAKKDNFLVVIYEGRTPCQELAKQLKQQPSADCIKIKWRLKLFKDGNEGSSGKYELEGFVFRKDKILKGNWHLIKGTMANPEAVIFQLHHPEYGSLLLQKGDDNVLFFLDPDKNIRIGNRDFSYTLNRTI